MAKSVLNAVLDNAFNYITSNVTAMHACSAEPLNLTEATSTYSLANVAMSAGDFTGPVDGDTNGRKITVNAKTGVSVATSGDANHVALVSGTELLYVTTATTQTLTSGNTMDFSAWDIEIADPT